MSVEKKLLERWVMQNSFAEYYALREETVTFLAQPEPTTHGFKNITYIPKHLSETEIEEFCGYTKEPVAWVNAITGDVTTIDKSDTLSWAPIYLAPKNQESLSVVSIDLLEALQDVLEDLKLRASLTDEPNVLNVSCGKLIKAEKAIANAKAHGIKVNNE